MNKLAFHPSFGAGFNGFSEPCEACIEARISHGQNWRFAAGTTISPTSSMIFVPFPESTPQPTPPAAGSGEIMYR